MYVGQEAEKSESQLLKPLDLEFSDPYLLLMAVESQSLPTEFLENIKLGHMNHRYHGYY